MRSSASAWLGRRLVRGRSAAKALSPRWRSRRETSVDQSAASCGDNTRCSTPHPVAPRAGLETSWNRHRRHEPRTDVRSSGSRPRRRARQCELAYGGGITWWPYESAQGRRALERPPALAVANVRLRPGQRAGVSLQTSEQLRSNNAQTAGKTGHHQGPEDEARHYETRPCTVCKTSIPGSNPGGASKIF